MNNWPLFEQRYTPEIISTAPEYQDTLIALLFVLVLVGALLWGINKRNSKKQSGSSKVIFIIYASLQTIVMIGLLFAQVTNGANGFWREMTYGMLYAMIYFGANTLLYAISWFAFGDTGRVDEWFGKYFVIWGILGFLLIIPLLALLSGISPSWVLIALSLAVYLFFRIGLVVISLTTFPKLHKYPLHIILYLCTCEIAPLLFVLV